MRKILNKKAQMTTGVWIIIALIVGVFFYTQGTFDKFLQPTEKDTPPEPGKCPSSGLTEVTINTQEALASTATASVHDYYVFEKDGTYVSTGNSGADGSSTFNVGCSKGKTYDLLVINETVDTGFYGQEIEIDASGPTFSKSLKTYEYGDINLVSVASDVDPSGNSNISAGLGKTCGFVITFTENESISAFNKPLILCEANVTSVVDVTMTGVTEASAKKPTRITPTSGYEYYTYELDKMLLSTDAAQKISGKIQFSSSNAPAAADTLSCKIIDQVQWKKANYQTLSKSEGFAVSAENQETNADVGAGDTAEVTMAFNHASGYC